MPLKRVKVILVLAVAALILSLPVFVRGPMLAGHDTKEHLSFGEHFAEQFWQGDLYPRWLLNMNNGLGSASFFVYPPFSVLRIRIAPARWKNRSPQCLQPWRVSVPVGVGAVCVPLDDDDRQHTGFFDRRSDLHAAAISPGDRFFTVATRSRNVGRWLGCHWCCSSLRRR